MVKGLVDLPGFDPNGRDDLVGSSSRRSWFMRDEYPET